MSEPVSTGPETRPATGNGGPAHTSASRRTESAPDARTDAIAARSFTVDGRTWEASVAGLGLAGSCGRSPARLMAVRFDAVDGEAPGRELLTGVRDLEALHVDELIEMFRAARPIESPPG